MNIGKLQKILISFLVIIRCFNIIGEINASDLNRTVYVARSTGGYYHYSSICGTMNNPISMTLQEAINKGKKPCSKCVHESSSTPTPTPTATPVSTLVPTVAPTAIPETLGGFIDINSSTAHVDDIIWLADNGISQGWTNADGTKEFRPLEIVKRCDMSAFLKRLAKVLGDSSVDSYTPSNWNRFIDVTEGAGIHETDILWLAENGISVGWTDGTFRPLQDVTRADMAAFLRRLAKKYNIGDAATWTPSEEDWNTFTDVTNGSGIHEEDILWLAHAGISQGWTMADSTKEFRPLTGVARCDMAAFLHRLANLK